MKITSKIPPLSYIDYPIDIQIRIYCVGTIHSMDIQYGAGYLRYNMNVSTNDLNNLNQGLSVIIKDIADAASYDEADLRMLAEKGYYAYKQIFNQEARDAIEKLVAKNSKVSFQITSENFFLPWELIYPVSPLERPLSADNFWGVNHIISRNIAQNSSPGAFVPPIIVASCPRLGLFTYRELKHIRECEIPFFESLAKDGRIELLPLRPLDPGCRQDELKELKGFCAAQLHIAHFACHASYDTQPDSTYVRLSDDFTISIQDLETADFGINGSPIVFLNACETGSLSPLYTPFFARAFIKYGARGVIATECAVPDSFAADFAKLFYQNLLGGETLGESLLKTRYHFIKKHNNLTGLIYSMYAPSSIKFVTH